MNLAGMEISYSRDFISLLHVHITQIGNRLPPILTQSVSESI